jgi:SAM-dependent methyltransferase
MKVRDSGMPDEATWEGFFDARRVLLSLDFPGGGAGVVDFGCGYGTFAVAAARLTTGPVIGLDTEPAMIAATRAKAAELGLANLTAIERDFVATGTGLRDSAADYAMLFNILHAERPIALLKEALRILRAGGRAAVIHWSHDRPTPRGPALEIRPTPEQCRVWLERAGFEIAVPIVELPPYHYGVVGTKPGAPPARAA